MKTIPEQVREQFAIGFRWPNGVHEMPSLICACKKCGSFWIAQNCYDIQKYIGDHITNFPCTSTLIGGGFSSEMEKILTALEKAE